MTAHEAISIDGAFVSRLLVGGLSEHEQRLIASRLLTRDATFRRDIQRALGSFQVFDLDLVARYAEALFRHRLDRSVDLSATRATLLDEAMDRIPDLDTLMARFTHVDVRLLGDHTRSIVSWTMAELLLLRAQHDAQNVHSRRAQLYLALAMIDIVDIMGAVGHLPRFPDVVADVRRRIRMAYTGNPRPERPRS